MILQLIAEGVQANEIAEILRMDKSNFSKAYPAGKLIKRMKEKAQKE